MSNQDTHGATIRVDLRGLKCPLPAMLFARALRQRDAGDVLEVEATDALAELDLQNEALKAGHLILAVEKTDGTVRVRVRIREGA